MPFKFKYTFQLLLFCILTLLSLSLASNAVLAQNPVSLSALEVDLWPEYDRPDVLVIYRISLSPEVSLPAELIFRIPAVSGEPNAVAVREPDGRLVNISYERVVNGDWAELSFNATLPEIQLEYYDPGITRDGTARVYEYRWLGDYSVQSLKMQVQQPLDATNLRTSPSLGTQVTGQDGLQYYNANIGALAAGQGFDVTVEYDKATDRLTAAGLPVQPSAPVGETAMGWRSQIAAALPWGLLALGVILLVGGAVWYWQSGRRTEEQKQPRRRRKAAVENEKPPAQGHVYCHACGKRAGPGDRFCRACGTRLRGE